MIRLDRKFFGRGVFPRYKCIPLGHFVATSGDILVGHVKLFILLFNAFNMQTALCAVWRHRQFTCIQYIEKKIQILSIRMLSPECTWSRAGLAVNRLLCLSRAPTKKCLSMFIMCGPSFAAQTKLTRCVLACSNT